MLKLFNRGKAIDKLIKARLGKKVERKKLIERFKMTDRFLLLKILCFLASINSWLNCTMEDINSLTMNLMIHLYF